MSVSFNVGILSGDQVPLAFPLIQATRRRRSGRGVLALRDQAGCICGVLAYRLDRDLRAGPMLAVHLFTAVDLLNSLRTVRALLEAADGQALELGCAGVQIRLRNDQSGLASHLRSLGVAPEASLLWKKIDSAQTRN